MSASTSARYWSNSYIRLWSSRQSARLGMFDMTRKIKKINVGRQDENAPRIDPRTQWRLSPRADLNDRNEAVWANAFSLFRAFLQSCRSFQRFAHLAVNRILRKWLRHEKSANLIARSSDQALFASLKHIEHPHSMVNAHEFFGQI